MEAWDNSADPEPMSGTSNGVNPELLVVDDILQTSAGGKEILVVRTGLTAVPALSVWPNNNTPPTPGRVPTAFVWSRDPSVKWTCEGTVQSYLEGFGDPAITRTLEVLLTSADLNETVIHSSETDESSPEA